METRRRHTPGRTTAVPAAAQAAFLSIPLVLLLLASCAGLGGGARAREAYGPARNEAPEPSGWMDEKAAPAASMPEGGAAVAAAPSAEPLASSTAGLVPAAPDVGTQPAQARQRVYSGSARLTVDDVEERKRNIALLVEGEGGYVEATYERSIVARVPAARFQEIFSRILTLGEVQHKSVETQDVTEAYSDLSARLGLAERTRERLYALLEKTSEVEERLRVLREIKRLSEEIERFRLTLELLDRSIAFSRIGVELTPRLDTERQGRQGIPFRWIAALDPVSASLGRLAGRVTIDLGDDFAVFSRERIFRAESPDGTRVRVGTTANRPRGDADFWRRALQVHLGRYYRSAEALDLGVLRAVLLVSKDRDPYGFLVGVVAAGADLHVVEVFFPNGEAMQKRLAAMRAALSQARVE